MRKQLVFISTAAVILLSLSGCWNNAKSDKGAAPESASAMSHSDMHHSDSGEIPPGLQKSVNPAFKPGTKAILKADHMPGMKGATATIVGAYSTTTYEVTYTPATGGEPVKHHKWVIQEEIKDAGREPLKKGTHAILEAEHMPGMKGAKAIIESAEKTNVYMVDYTPTTGGAPVKNHKWVTESELSAS
ncbi:YdhK family protein [Paenibacillus donghaensis]|uniref:YdhK family protein n=1 Tax=Paenibacillus donghaensis TaxID=414771 RepID=UPI00188354EA|nr:YdhK family protein [Paenibacillus donghaensis]MBE9912722.1 YdhK family protein [Paenibacillus donghaensis]